MVAVDTRRYEVIRAVVAAFMPWDNVINAFGFVATIGTLIIKMFINSLDNLS
jgi:hypothetical protein